MVFSSVPVYLDPPNYLQQQPINYQQGAVGDQNLQLPAPPPPPPGGGGGGSAVGITGGSVRSAGSLSERARLAKIPQPEVALKCPRCESTNTKFCYFNNYSLSQPRHFCKTCRRYWTRGGALRNVPVGGGCRRNNKRSKGSRARSKSPINLAGSAGSSGSGLFASNSCTNSHAIIGHMPPPPPPQLPHILPPYDHLGTHYNSINDIGLNFVGIQPPLVATTGDGSGSVEFQIGNNSSSGGVSGSVLSSSGLVEQWRLQQQVQQFPFLTNLGPPSIGLDPFGNVGGMEGPNYVGHQIRSSKPLDTGITTSHPAAAATVKMEENHELKLSKKNLGVSGNDQYYWGGGNNIAWTDNLPGFTSSSTGHLL